MGSRLPRIAFASLALALAAACGSSTPPPAPTIEASIPVSRDEAFPESVTAPSQFRLTFSQAIDMPGAPAVIGLEVHETSGGWTPFDDAETAWDSARPTVVVVQTRSGLPLPEGRLYRITVGTGLTFVGGGALPSAWVGHFATAHGVGLGRGGIAGAAASRSVVYVVSDIHMGDTRSVDEADGPHYGWFKANGDALQAFLEKAALTDDLKEIVVAGDLVDEWVAPMNVTAFAEGQTHDQFLQSVKDAHPGVFGAFAAFAAVPGVRLVYAPGNHDMLVQPEQARALFPGMTVARDGFGIGRYTPPEIPTLVVEHGHRYDFFNAPDPISGSAVDGGSTILPPGFFVSKVASTSDRERGRPPGVTGPLTGQQVTASAVGLDWNSEYLLYSAAWLSILVARPILEPIMTRPIETGIDGFTGAVTLADLVPHPVGTELDVNLYRHIENNWPLRQAANGVPAPISKLMGVIASAAAPGIDVQASYQYFENPASDARIVVFGHTHEVRLHKTTNRAGKGAVYANSGTWVDHHAPAADMTYVTIAPPVERSDVTTVATWRFDAATHQGVLLESVAIRP